MAGKKHIMYLVGGTKMKRPKAYSSLVNKLPINNKKKFWLLRFWKGALAGLIIYLFIGIYFTMLRSDSHYTTFVVDEDPILNNGLTYWDNRCVPEYENKVYGTPGAIWCIDSSGKFHTEKPTKSSWYPYFYGKYKASFVTTTLFWPIHFVGVDMIHFRSEGFGW